MALNHIDLMGRICNEIELRRTSTGVAVASFTLAVDRDFKGENGEKETDFIEIVCWRQTAEFVSKFFSKGKMAIVSGRLQNRKWTDKDGNKRTKSEVVADNVYFGEKKETEAGSFAHQTTAQPADFGNYMLLEGDDNVLPF